MWWIFKRIFWAAVWQVVWSWIKDHLLGISGGCALSGLVSFLWGLEWPVWFFGIGFIVCLVLWVWDKRGKRQWKIIPTKYGKRGDEEGLFIKNVSNDPAYDVSVEPFSMGHLMVSWRGPEVAVLEAGHECFFYPETKGTPYNGPLTHASSGFFVLLRNWQSAIEDLKAEVEGIIRYKDAKFTPQETRYRVGVDLHNGNGGLVVRVV